MGFLLALLLQSQASGELIIADDVSLFSKASFYLANALLLQFTLCIRTDLV